MENDEFHGETPGSERFSGLEMAEDRHNGMLQLSLKVANTMNFQVTIKDDPKVKPFQAIQARSRPIYV